ncbi:hypothetical protein M569_13462, partial [Genlisea aurea]
EKRVRFPKGKKVKVADKTVDVVGEEIPSKDPRLAARDRAARRNTFLEEHTDDVINDRGSDVKKAEVQYEDNETFVEEGIAVDPFNLEKEREEGFFDENGNYVEYINRNEVKDAWLDSLDSHTKYTGKSSIPTISDDKPVELSTEVLAEINKRISDILHPGETVLRGLKRLKGSTDKKHKMSVETKRLFDQLTEDAMALMDDGYNDVYDKKQEQFAIDAGGFESLVSSRKGKGGVLETPSQGNDDVFDMFGDDDSGAAANPASNGSGSASSQLPEDGGLQHDYVYDESSGYYYSSSLGYFYDPSTGLYGCAASGVWYSYDVESGTYNEVRQ